MGLAVEHLRIHALPPFSFAVSDCLQAVIRNTGKHSGRIALVVNRKKLIPCAVRRSVIAHAKRKPLDRAIWAHVPTTSRLGPMLTQFHGWYFEFQQSKLSWCVARATR